MPGRVQKSLRIVLLLALLSSCDSTTNVVAPLPVAPQATSGAGAARVLEWAVGHSRPDVLEGLLSADFELFAVALDSAGNQTRVGIPRDTVLAAFRAMLEGVPGKSLPATATLVLDRTLIPLPDPRPGRDSRVHHALRSSCDFRVDDPTSQGAFEVTGFLRFFVSRADSCALPAGSTTDADTTRWWITRIEDETLPAGGGPRAGATPSKNFSLWRVLEIFLARTRG
jgi:hypothetical protein